MHVRQRHTHPTETYTPDRDIHTRQRHTHLTLPSPVLSLSFYCCCFFILFFYLQFFAFDLQLFTFSCFTFYFCFFLQLPDEQGGMASRSRSFFTFFFPFLLFFSLFTFFFSFSYRTSKEEWRHVLGPRSVINPKSIRGSLCDTLLFVTLFALYYRMCSLTIECVLLL